MGRNILGKAQASFEYLAIFAIGFVVLIPLVYMFQQYSLESAEQVQVSSIGTIGNDLINTAEAVYYMGYPARLTLQETFPSGIIGMDLLANWTDQVNIITFYLSDDSELSFYSPVNLNMTISESYYTPGLKNIVVETRNSTQGTYVHIEFE